MSAKLFLTILLLVSLLQIVVAAQDTSQGAATHSGPATVAIEVPDAGTISGNTYHNQFFGFTYEFPKGWMVSQATEPSSKPGVYVLLFAFQHHHFPEISAILVRAVKLSSPDTTAKEFLLSEYPEQEQRGAKPQGEPKGISVNGWSFYLSRFKQKVGGGVIDQEYLATTQKGYALEFFLSSNQKEVFKAMQKTINTLSVH